MVKLLSYIRYKNNLGLRYYAKIEDAPLSNLLRQYIINTENQLMVLSDLIWQECLDIGISTGSYIVFNQGGTIDHCTHVSGPVSQSSAKSEYNTAWTGGMALAHFRKLNNELSNKDTYLVP